MLADGTAYRCYCTKEELDKIREEQMARKEKPRYPGIWRDRTDARPGVEPVIRFKNPIDGAVVVNDLVHGSVTFQNTELDDLIIARSTARRRITSVSWWTTWIWGSPTSSVAMIT